jgi:O-antigen ligase
VGLAVAVLLAVSLGAGAVAARDPGLAVAAVVGAGFVAWAASHVLAGVAVLTVSFFFENFLTSGGFFTPAKAIGVLALGAWLVDWLLRRRPILVSPQLWPIAGLAVWLVLSSATAHDLGAAVTTSSRWAMFFLLFFLVLQAVRSDRRRATVLVDVMVASAGVAAVVGLWYFFVGLADRASGPLEDPNDFAFVLASVVPLAIWRIGTAPRRARWLPAVALVAMFAAVLASFSRTALLALAVAGCWAVLTRRIRLRWAAVAAAAVVLTGLVAWILQPQTVEEALGRKQAVAGYNVDTRVSFWGTAVRQFQSSPVFGVGPGGYEARFFEFNPEYGTFDRPIGVDGAPTTHNTYLNVLAELGVVGTGLFVAYLALAWRDLRRRWDVDPQRTGLQGALAAGFVVAIVGSVFLTQQFYAPVWLIGALGASLAAGAPSRRDVVTA